MPSPILPFDFIIVGLDGVWPPSWLYHSALLAKLKTQVWPTTSGRDGKVTGQTQPRSHYLFCFWRDLCRCRPWRGLTIISIILLSPVQNRRLPKTTRWSCNGFSRWLTPILWNEQRSQSWCTQCRVKQKSCKASQLYSPYWMESTHIFSSQQQDSESNMNYLSIWSQGAHARVSDSGLNLAAYARSLNHSACLTALIESFDSSSWNLNRARGDLDGVP